MSDRNIINMEDDLMIFGCGQEQVSELTDKITKMTSPDEMKLVLIDSIGRFDCFYNDPHLLFQPIQDYEEQRMFFEWLNKEIRRRLEAIAKEHLHNLEEYNQKCSEDKIPFILVVIHEVTDVKLSENVEMARALLYDDNAGVYFIVFTKASKEELDLGTDLNMFKVMEYDDALTLISSESA